MQVLASCKTLRLELYGTCLLQLKPCVYRASPEDAKVRGNSHSRIFLNLIGSEAYKGVLASPQEKPYLS